MDHENDNKSVENKPSPKRNWREIELKIFDSNNRISSLDKRIDDLKWFLSGTITFFGIIFSVLALIFNSNFNSEKESLKEFKTELKAELGKAQIPPVIELLTMEHKPLSESEIPVTIRDSVSDNRIMIIFIIKNTGGSTSGKIYIKLYTNELIALSNSCTDEDKYSYETYYTPSDLTPNELPSHYSSEYFITFRVKAFPKPGKYPILIKIFYGNDLVTRSEFKIIKK